MHSPNIKKQDTNFLLLPFYCSLHCIQYFMSCFLKIHNTSYTLFCKFHYICDTVIAAFPFGCNVEDFFFFNIHLDIYL